MVGRKSKRSNLEQDLPEGLLVDAGWLKGKGYSRQLWNHYVATGLLEQPAPRVFRRSRGSLAWQQAVISLQTLLEYPLVVGGRTALELQGYAHYLRLSQREIHLYGPKRPPHWLDKLKLPDRFVYHNDRPLFPYAPKIQGPDVLTQPTAAGGLTDANLTVQPWGQWDWPLTLSAPERAMLELLNELPARESFEQADKLFEGLTNLRPRRMQHLLADCKSIKVKRLFLFFADRHRHAWLAKLDKSAVDLGKGKRMLVKGGRLDAAYQITVPEDLHAVP